jgi:hypothetical protein
VDAPPCESGRDWDSQTTNPGSPASLLSEWEDVIAEWYEKPLNAPDLITSARQAPKWAAVLTTRIENGIATASCWNSFNKPTYSNDPPQY